MIPRACDGGAATGRVPVTKPFRPQRGVRRKHDATAYEDTVARHEGQPGIELSPLGYAADASLATPRDEKRRVGREHNDVPVGHRNPARGPRITRSRPQEVAEDFGRVVVLEPLDLSVTVPTPRCVHGVENARGSLHDGSVVD